MHVLQAVPNRSARSRVRAWSMDTVRILPPWGVNRVVEADLSSAMTPRIVVRILLLAVSMLSACTTMTPASLTVSAPAEDVFTRARRAMAEQGLDAAEQDDDAGVLRSDWVVYSTNDTYAYVYRLVVFVEERGGKSDVSVRAEAQQCPPDTTVFDRCETAPGKIVPKAVQSKIDTVSAALRG